MVRSIHVSFGVKLCTTFLTPFPFSLLKFSPTSFYYTTVVFSFFIVPLDSGVVLSVGLCHPTVKIARVYFSLYVESSDMTPCIRSLYFCKVVFMTLK